MFGEMRAGEALLLSFSIYNWQFRKSPTQRSIERCWPRLRSEKLGAARVIREALVGVSTGGRRNELRPARLARLIQASARCPH